jgi:DNA-directed RNA polymerase specialized sigma24 family protein
MAATTEGSTAMNPTSTAPLADPSLRSALVSMARKRVPPSEVDEIVQATLTEAIASPHRPPEGEALRRWVHGIARHKIADFHRRTRREQLGLDDDDSARAIGEDDHAHADDASHDAVDLLRWAEREAPAVPEAARTIEWMLREGEGEKLESIARDASLPAPQVRQRVARMRRHFRARWAAQLAAVAVLLAVIALAVWYLRRSVPMTRPGSTTEMIDPVARGREILAESHIGVDPTAKSAPPIEPAPPPPDPTIDPSTKSGKKKMDLAPAKPKPTNAPFGPK